MTFQIDVSLAVMVLVANGIGYWMSRSKVREWCVPVTVLLSFVSLALVMFWSCIRFPVASFAGFVEQTLKYVLPNTVAVWFTATQGYDVVHEFAKRKEGWANVAKAIASVFRHKEDE